MRPGREVSQHGDFQVATVPSVQGGGFVAWAKAGEIVSDTPVTEPGDPIWFEFGPTRNEATARLLRELGLTQ
jgi:hypothetical protein